MILTSLVMIVCLAMAAAILGIAIVWALMDARRGDDARLDASGGFHGRVGPTAHPNSGDNPDL